MKTAIDCVTIVPDDCVTDDFAVARPDLSRDRSSLGVIPNLSPIEGSVLCIDPDYFSRYIRKYGHARASAALSQIDAVVVDLVEACGTVCWPTDGDELFAYLPGGDDPALMAAMIRLAVAELPINVTVSVGVGSDLESASLAMDFARALGGNTVCLHMSPVYCDTW